MEQWNLEGLTVTGLYLKEIPVKGKVSLSRVTYGGGIQHHIQLNEPIDVYGELRERVILDHAYIETVR